MHAINVKEYQEYTVINNEKNTVSGVAAQENDIVLFIFGEIDVRNHIGRQRDLYGHTLDIIITTLVNNYLKTIILNRAQFETLHCVVVGIIPPAQQMLINTLPIYGSIQDRVEITTRLNTQLEAECTRHDIMFLPTYDLYALPNGSLNPALSDGMVHIAKEHNYLIRNRLVELLEKEKII